MPAPLTEDLIVSLASPDDPQLSPDGSRVAYVAACYGQEGDHPEGTIWVAPTDGSAMARQWTFGGGRDDTPRWSPDSQTLAFLSDRATRGTKALYRMPAAGGEAEQLIERKKSIAFLAWSPDGARIAFLAPDDPTDDERREKEHDDADVYGERWPYHRLHLLDLASGAVTTLPTGNRHVTECAWSPDGATIAYFAQPTPELDDRHQSVIFTISAAGGDARQVCRTTGGGNLAWSASEAIGDMLVFGAPHEQPPQCSTTVWAVSAGGGEPTVIGPGVNEAACAVGLHTAPGQPRITIALAKGLTTELVNFNTPTGLPALFCAHPTGDLGPFSVAMRPHAAAPVVAVVRSAGDEPPELWVGAPDALHRVSDHHAALRDIQFGNQEPFYWDAPDGLALDGLLIRPPGAPAGPLPTIVYVHGGPYGRWTNSWNLRPNNWGQWLATHGYAVLMPNCRGGLGHGNAFATAARGDVGGADYRDIMAAVDAAIARGIADPERLGIGGWSQGGFMTAWAVTQTNRFKAGVMGAGVSDWNMMTMSSDLPTFEAALGGDRPWDGPGPHNAARLSPISYAKNATTPLLILHGKNDARVPVTQAIGFARALRERDVPLQFVTYPREPHGVRERNHQRDILRRVRAWYDQWLNPGGENT